MDTNIYWQAIETRDARFDGAFVYGVSSTKIYCKPSCSSRRPNRKNVQFFESFKRAEIEGFRPCRRCRPETQRIDPQTEVVLRACEILAAGERVLLEELSARLGLSRAHLQKIFKQIIGVSPKKFAEIKRLECFKAEIRNGSDVTGAIYGAGFGSSSRLYENVSGKLGMTPAVYRRGGPGAKIYFTVADCELGQLLVARTDRGLCAVAFGDDENMLEQDLRREFFCAEITRDETEMKDFVEAILANLSGTRRSLDLPLDLRATAFQMRVWDVLRKIPYGETITYQQIAEKLGNPQAVRAVAGACASNRAALVIPCHRVIRSDGSLSGYRWGVERKQKLLAKEKQKSASGEPSGAGCRKRRL